MALDAYGVVAGAATGGATGAGPAGDARSGAGTASGPKTAAPGAYPLCETSILPERTSIGVPGAVDAFRVPSIVPFKIIVLMQLVEENARLR